MSITSTDEPGGGSTDQASSSQGFLVLWLFALTLLAASSLVLGILAVAKVYSDEDTTTPMAMEESPVSTAAADQDSEAVHNEEGHADSFAWGEPATAAAADRVIEIEAHDDFSYTPSNIDVRVGETVTFQVTNIGKLPHDFTLGDKETQAEHDAEMADMAGMTEMDHEEANAMSLPVGETHEMTWTFLETGEIQMGCHVPGHYAAGMFGTITITEAS